MRDTPGSPIISPKLQKIAEQARKYPEMMFNNLYHLIDHELLLEAYHRTSKDSAPGVDKVTAQEYAEALYDNLHDLRERLKSNRYVPRQSSGYGSRRTTASRDPSENPATRTRSSNEQ
jgi:hypothetical protein